MKRYFYSFLLFILFFPLPAQSVNISGSGSVFSFDLRTDTVLMAEGLVLSGGDLFLDNVLEVNRAEYDPSKVYDKNDVNAFDRFFMNQYSSSLDRAGDAGLVMCMLTPAFLLACDKDEWLTAAVMYAETLLIANGIKELTKLAVRRDRPFMYYESSTYPEDDIKDGDFANSFPSGHSTISFAAATFTSYTFSRYFPDSPYRHAVTGTSYALAALTAFLRVKSGNHFVTDVMTGAALGSAVGFLVPWLHTFNVKNEVNLAFTGDGLLVRVRM